MNKSLVLFITFLFINTMGHSFAADNQLITPSKKPIPPASQTPAWSDWANGRKAATVGVARAIANWQSQALLQNVLIIGVAASGGSVTGPALKPSIERTMTEAGVPANVTNAFASSVSNAWSMWASSLRVPGLKWYPSFACYPGPQAPPTPNIPTPLAALGGNPEPLSAPRLKASIRNALDTRADDREASAAINKFADDFAARFTKYRASVMVTRVMGTGPVPQFAPPYGPNCGQVVGGRGDMQTGGFVGTWPAN